MKKEDLIKMIQEQVPDGGEVWFWGDDETGWRKMASIEPPNAFDSFYKLDAVIEEGIE